MPPPAEARSGSIPRRSAPRRSRRSPAPRRRSRVVRTSPPPPSPARETPRPEKALEGGQTPPAAQAVLGPSPRIRPATAGANPLETRALRVFALSVVRSDGSVDEKKAHVASANGVDWTP